MKLIALRQRRWWQFWKPKRYSEVLADEPCQITLNDRVTVRQVGDSYIGMVNDDPVLRWPDRDEEDIREWCSR